MTLRSSPPLKWHNKLACVMLVACVLAGGIGIALHELDRFFDRAKVAAAKEPGPVKLKSNDPRSALNRLSSKAKTLPRQVAFEEDWIGWIHAGAVAEGKYKPVYPKGAKL